MKIDSHLTGQMFPAGFQEDDALRSEFIRRLLTDEPPAVVPASEISCRIPKVLIRFWHDNDDIPHDVQECLDTWKPLTSAGFDVRTFDDASAAAYIKEIYGQREVTAFHRCRHPAMRSDYFRMCYLFSTGGFYVDADDVLTGGCWSKLYADDHLKLQPLCYEIPTGTMVSMKDLGSTECTPNRIFYVNNNPLVAPAGHPVLRRALERSTCALTEAAELGEIQSTTGPGNLTAALAAHASELELAGRPRDFELMHQWDSIAETRWDLSYREDWRNWRNIGRC